VIVAGGTCNHIHLLVALPSDVTLGESHSDIQSQFVEMGRRTGISFAWQEGYGALSVSSSNLAIVRNHIEHQAEHHARRSSEDEYLTPLHKCGVKYEQEHVFG